MRWSCIFLCTGLSWYDIIRWVYIFWRNVQFTWPSLFLKFLTESEAILLLYLTKKCCVLVIAVVCFKIWLIGVFHWCFQWRMRLLRKEKLKKGRKIAFRPQVLIGSCISTFLFIGFRPLVFCLRSSLCCRPFMYRRIVTIADGRSGYAVLVCNNERRGKLCINDQRGKQLNVRRKLREVCSTDRSSMLIPTRILIKPGQLRIFFNCNRSTLTISWNYLF